MNNEKYLDELDGRLQVLNELRKRIIELSKAIIGDTLYKEDFFFTCQMAGHFLCLGGDHLRKLKKYKPTKFKAKDSVYNKELADYAVSFIECLCHTKGTWAGKPFELIDWQEQIIRDIGKIGTCGCSGTASDLWRWRRER